MNTETIAFYIIIGAIGLIGVLFMVFPSVLMGERKRLWYLAIGAFFVGLFPEKWQVWVVRFIGAIFFGFTLLAFLGNLIEIENQPQSHLIAIEVDSVPTPQPLATQASPGTLEEADRILEEAAKKWQAGDRTGSIDLAEKALDIQIRILGATHETVVKTKTMITNAKLDLIQDGLNASSQKP